MPIREAETIVGVIGAGAMGSGIAQVAATAGHHVIFRDISDDVVQRMRDALLGKERLNVRQRRTDGEWGEWITLELNLGHGITVPWRDGDLEVERL